MTIVLLGKVLKTTVDQLEIQDQVTKQTITAYLGGNSLDVTVGTEGIFVGTYTGEKFHIKRVSEKKFLSPLYEEELIKIGSIINLYDEMRGPFDEFFKKLV